jgi:hypothetical protein
MLFSSVEQEERFLVAMEAIAVNAQRRPSKQDRFLRKEGRKNEWAQMRDHRNRLAERGITIEDVPEDDEE